jgi:hypothetical protein
MVQIGTRRDEKGKKKEQARNLKEKLWEERKIRDFSSITHKERKKSQKTRKEKNNYASMLCGTVGKKSANNRIHMVCGTSGKL